VLSLLCVLTAAASAGVGWATRPSVPESKGSAVPKEPNAEQQFQKALLKVNDEDAFRAVKANFPDAADIYYRQLADEQLTFLYLRDVSNPDHKSKIQSQLDELASYSDEARKKAAIGKAYLLAFSVSPPDNGAKLGARVTLDQAGLNVLVPDSPLRRGQWGKYYNELRGLLDDQPGGEPPGGGPPQGRNFSGPPPNGGSRDGFDRGGPDRPRGEDDRQGGPPFGRPPGSEGRQGERGGEPPPRPNDRPPFDGQRPGQGGPRQGDR
jgi:hypothetical protein